ncbi:uncharacterized protein LOC125237482 [Leguminivora glycinivorella]|uniref:uncharacterized protein LOC125237482 n=1 Tax=Leguminivora glycinivorella TaxID=1035111 RepID=UPI00200DA03F|nr:uncharacterized protein LOC125237482 [Leguminivora glycinivorella]
MATKMTLEMFDKQLSDFKIEDIQKKIDIASNVSKQCDIPRASSKGLKDVPAFKMCQTLTGVPEETLRAINSLSHKSIKFDDWLKSQKLLIQNYNTEYNNIRKLLLRDYTQRLEIPKRTQISSDDYEGYKKYFTSIQLPGTKASIIVEKPETVIERQRFLHTKMLYREEKKNMVYIGKVNLLLNNGKFTYKEDTVEAKTRFITAASQKYGYLGFIYCCGNSQEYMANWIDEKILPHLPEKSVIIFQENVLSRDEDKVVSDISKEEILKWLKENEVPHDPKLHRAELYKLVNIFQKSCAEKLSPAELSFRARGHITIRKKRCNLNANYFDPFWGFLVKELNSAMPLVKPTVKHHYHAINNNASMILQNCPIEYWNNLGNILQAREIEIYREDLQIEHVLDKLMTKVKHEGLPKEWESEFDEYSREEEKYILLSDNLMQLYVSMQKTQYYKSLNIYKK